MGEDCAAHDRVYAALAALLVFVDFTDCNDFAVVSLKSPIKFAVDGVSYFKFCWYEQSLGNSYFLKGYLKLVRIREGQKF